MIVYIPLLILLIALARSRYLPQVHLEGKHAHIARASIASFIWIITVSFVISLGMYAVLGVPFLVLGPFVGAWLACRVVPPERRLIMRLVSGILCGSVCFGIATIVIFSSASAEKIDRIRGHDYGLFIYVVVGLSIASWLGALIFSASSPH